MHQLVRLQPGAFARPAKQRRLHGDADRHRQPVISSRPRRCASIPVVLGLEGAGAGKVEVVGLGGAERGQLDAELVEVERGAFSSRCLGKT